MTENPVQTQIIPNTEPFVNWGVRFIRENVVSVYGPGEEAKAAAEDTVAHWASTPYPAELVSQVVLPWSSDTNTKVELVANILNARSDPQAVIRLREWLKDNGHDDFDSPMADPKTRLKHQVPLVKKIRRHAVMYRALEDLDLWLVQNGYTSNTRFERLEVPDAMKPLFD